MSQAGNSNGGGDGAAMEGSSSPTSHSLSGHDSTRLTRHCEAIACSSSGAVCVATSALSGRIWDGCLYVFNAPHGLSPESAGSASCSSADVSLTLDTGVSDVVWASNQVLAASTDAGSLALFSFSQDKACLQPMANLRRHDGTATCVAAYASVSSPSSGGGASPPNVLTGGADGRVVRWDLERNQAVEDIRAHTAPVRRIATATGHPALLASCAVGDRSLLWDMRTSHVSPCCVLPVGRFATAAAFSVGDVTVAVGTVHGEVSTFDVRNVVRPLVTYSHGDEEVTRLAFSPQHSPAPLLASCGGQQLSYVVAVGTTEAKEVHRWTSSDSTAVARGLCWSPNGLLHSCGLNCGMYTTKV